MPLLDRSRNVSCAALKRDAGSVPDSVGASTALRPMAKMARSGLLVGMTSGSCPEMPV
jgi:hypothetical protein